ncbi:MAG: IS91 family transposase, partial [Flavobacteriaceae bacterium]
MAAKHTVAAVLNQHQDALSGWVKNTWKSRTLHAIRKCRTKALGGHIDQCDCCDKLHLSYNSCRNRHCPNCQGHKRQQWIAARNNELLEVPYFHVVFTIDHKLNDLCLINPKLVYATLFKTAWATLAGFAQNPTYLDARIGAIMLLHTWGQNLSLHPHVHCIVPAGGVDKNGKWKKSKNKGDFLFPVKEMSKVFRAKFVAELRKSKAKVPQKTYDKLFSKPWVVYAKQAFG